MEGLGETIVQAIRRLNLILLLTSRTTTGTAAAAPSAVPPPPPTTGAAASSCARSPCSRPCALCCVRAKLEEYTWKATPGGCEEEEVGGSCLRSNVGCRSRRLRPNCRIDSRPRCVRQPKGRERRSWVRFWGVFVGLRVSIALPRSMSVNVTITRNTYPGHARGGGLHGEDGLQLRQLLCGGQALQPPPLLLLGGRRLHVCCID